jgi:diguanylate cyclase (GGDEF)-like protein
MTSVRLSEEPVLVVFVLTQFEDRSRPRGTPEVARAAARFDLLTGLLNIRAMDETFRAFFSGADIRQAVVAIWDIDGLELINDTHGHAVGDQVVRWVGYRLEGTIGALGAVARTAGGQFTVLLPDIGKAEGRTLFERALEAIRVPMGHSTFRSPRLAARRG